MSIEDIISATGLPEEDARDGVLDLEDAALINRLRTSVNEIIWPNPGLFVEFDKRFAGIDSPSDALALANWLLSSGHEQISVQAVADAFTSWSVRRLNSAIHFLEGAEFIEGYRFSDGTDWVLSRLHVTDRTRRFVRDNR